MAAVNPQTFFRFAADHHELLVELYQRRDGITEAELLQLVRRFSGEGGPSASYLVDRLRELGFIDYAPQATAQYEMTRPFAELMSSLLREYRLTSVEVIRSYFTAMDSMAGEIAQATESKNGDLMIRALNDTSGSEGIAPKAQRPWSSHKTRCHDPSVRYATSPRARGCHALCGKCGWGGRWAKFNRARTRQLLR